MRSHVCPTPVADAAPDCVPRLLPTPNGLSHEQTLHTRAMTLDRNGR